ncbi:MAG TPA: D-aminoacylase [Thermomicrobiales bacterium]|jgi:N-acyl-D-amino-acid deacylase|nr:D-aminoacylase [Thermomicrobiales bacterium]
MTDILITGGRIIDGTGNAWFYGDVAITGDRIERVAPPGTIDRDTAATVVDASGHVVAPGFIDIQSHSIIPFLIDGRSLSKVTQGITTEIMGEFWTPAPFGGRVSDPFGIALVHRLQDDEAKEWGEVVRTWKRFGDWLAFLEDKGVSVNVGSFLGGGTVREYAMGESMGEPTEEQLAEMRRITAESMEDGAFGVASALIYPPNIYSSTHELTEVMKVVAAYNGVHITHMRSESARILEALEETIGIAKDSGVITEIYHLKASGKGSWEFMPAVIERITEARAQGLDIAADMYPYEASGTGLSSSVPAWAAADGKLFENLRDPETRARMLADMRDTNSGEGGAHRTGPEGTLLAEFRNPELAARFQGKTLDVVADELGMEWNEALLWLLDEDQSAIFTMFFGMSTENLEMQVKQPWIKWGTDAGGVDPAWQAERGLVHPRAYGTYPRILGRFVRENGWITLEDAVRKGTSAVADRLGIRDRGLLRDGMKADVIVFDPETIIDHSDYTDPHHLSTGVRDVFVNGVAVVHDGKHTGATPGTRVFGPGYKN